MPRYAFYHEEIWPDFSPEDPGDKWQIKNTPDSFIDLTEEEYDAYVKARAEYFRLRSWLTVRAEE